MKDERTVLEGGGGGRKGQQVACWSLWARCSDMAHPSPAVILLLLAATASSLKTCPGIGEAGQHRLITPRCTKHCRLSLEQNILPW